MEGLALLRARAPEQGSFAMSKERMYGYVRVSAQEQNEERQLIAMREFGVEEEYIVIEKQSGKDFKRPRYRAMLRQMHAGDVLVIKSIDRLGRNYTAADRHCGAGHAPFGHAAGAGPHRDLDRGHRIAAAQLCGPDGAGEYPAAAG